MKEMYLDLRKMIVFDKVTPMCKLLQTEKEVKKPSPLAQKFLGIIDNKL